MSAVQQIFKLGFPWQTFDPFLFCVYHNDKFPQGNGSFGPNASLEGRNIGQDFAWKDGWNMYHGKKVPGFPGHPHRGFETITVVNEGLVDHADSLSAAGRYGGGDTQWMTAGKGVQHSEMFPLVNTDSPNPLELFQIWLNLPAVNKLSPPDFKMLWREEIPIVNVSDGNKTTTIKVVAGEFEGKKPPSPPSNSWAAVSSNEVAVWQIKIPQGGSIKIPTASKGLNRVLYVFEGQSVTIDKQAVSLNYGAKLHSDHAVTITADEEPAQLLMLQGRPINEPIVRYGPFVMNSEAEIHQAFEDFRQTQFGGWPWDSIEPIHEHAKGRFARYIDGRLVEKEL